MTQNTYKAGDIVNICTESELRESGLQEDSILYGYAGLAAIITKVTGSEYDTKYILQQFSNLKEIIGEFEDADISGKLEIDPATALFIGVDYDKIRELAKRAYNALSFNPEKRAEGEKKELRSILYKMLMGLSELPEERKTAAFKWYSEKYISKLSVLLAARSRCMSTMITGPANFPVRQQEKCWNTEYKRLSELVDWQKKYTPERVRKMFAPAQAAADERARELESFQIMVISSIKRIFAGDEYMRALLIGRVETKIRNRDYEAAEFAVKYFKETGAFRPSNKIFKLYEAMLAIPTEEKEGKEYEINGITVSEDVNDNRIRIYFDGKPADEVRAALKSNAWKWSRTNGAWQRQLTHAAVADARTLIEKFY